MGDEVDVDALLEEPYLKQPEVSVPESRSSCFT